ncbi:uncharacterized protein LOC143463120 isoform X1 [Clavelina lepadiformis]|uniref:uncharacterized protein LOC143463120 isoform X1 n=1 Tax=Clavelina lepadiformis TaxID=159417 RepID=UPI004043115F
MKIVITLLVLGVCVFAPAKINAGADTSGKETCNESNSGKCGQSSTLLEKTTCAALPDKLVNGNFTCTDSNVEGSVCEFHCSKNNFFLHPPTSIESTCLSTGKWSKPIPCCAQPCPPYLVLDMAVLIHRSNYDDFDSINAINAELIPRLKMGEGGLHYARMYFSGKIHEPRILFKDSAKMTSIEVLQKVNREFHFNNTEDGRVNIGAALRYVKDNVFGVEGDRPDVPNVLFVSTDSNSDDDVVEAAQALKDAGVLINSAFYAREGVVPNDQMLIDIASDPRLITRNEKNPASSYYQKRVQNFLQQSCYSTCKTYA